MRIILYTGKGGVGKTSIAASTAIKIAKRGLKTIVLSTDAAHSLGDSFDIDLSPEPVKIMENLWAQEIDSIHEVEKGWGKVQKYITTLLTSKTIKDITTEELTVFPGMEDLLSLIRVLNYYKEKTYDVIIIDCAPTGETLALLSFPEMMKWWMDKMFPIKRKAAKIVKPIVEPLFKIPLPSDDVLGEIENIYNQLDEMRTILGNRDVTSVRIVVNPEKMVIKEAQRSFTYLNVYDYNVDSIVINRVMPAEVEEGYFSGWKNIHKKYKELILENFSPIPIYEAPLFDKEVVGIDMLEKMGDEVFKNENPVEIKYNVRTQEIKKDNDEYEFSIYLPFSDKKDIDLSQKGDELIIKTKNLKRNIILPRTIQSLDVIGAKFEEDYLKVRFGVMKNE